MCEKRILITGASSGIGREVSILLSSKGYKCILIGRNEDRLIQTIKYLHGKNHTYLVGDLSKSDFYEEVASTVDLLDGIVFCAGIIKISPLQYINEKEFNSIMRVNCYSSIFILKNLLNKKKLNSNSSIVLISSISGSHIGSFGNVMYSVSKSAIKGAVKTLALELSRKKIRINSISPGMVKTELWENNIISQDQLIEDEKKYPLGYGSPKDITPLISYLLSDSSSWVTGSDFIIDGGFTVQ